MGVLLAFGACGALMLAGCLMEKERVKSNPRYRIAYLILSLIGGLVIGHHAYRYSTHIAAIGREEMKVVPALVDDEGAVVKWRVVPAGKVE